MPYTSNPYAAKARRLAVNDVRLGRLTQAQAARKYGVTKSAVCKWLKRAHPDHRVFLHTMPSRPKHHPNQLSSATVTRILQLRKKLNRCAPIIHAHLRLEGFSASLSSVERTLRRHKLTRKKKQASWYVPLPRPLATTPGALVQVDTIHFIKPDKSRFYIYAVIDIFSRLVYAEYQPKLSQRTTYEVIMHAQRYLGFPFTVVQTDNGPEFKDWYRQNLDVYTFSFGILGFALPMIMPTLNGLFAHYMMNILEGFSQRSTQYNNTWKGILCFTIPNGYTCLSTVKHLPISFPSS